MGIRNALHFIKDIETHSKLGDKSATIYSPSKEEGIGYSNILKPAASENRPVETLNWHHHEDPSGDLIHVAEGCCSLWAIQKDFA